MIQKGLSPYDMLAIFDIIKKHFEHYPIEEFAKDFDTYGGIKASCFKANKDLESLKGQLAVSEFKIKMRSIE